MHELSLAQELVHQLERLAAERGIARFTEVIVRCGAMQQVVPESLALAFEVLTPDTPAAGAKLKIVAEPIRARCRACGSSFEAAIDDYTCPACARADVEIIAGRDLVLQTVTGEAADAAAGQAEQAASGAQSGAAVPRGEPEGAA